MKDALDRYIDYLVAEKHFMGQTATVYRSNLNQLLRFLQPSRTSWNEVSQDDLTRYFSHLQEQRLARSTLKHRQSTFRSFFRFLEATGLTDTNPTLSPRRPPPITTHAFLYPREVQALLLEAAKEDTPKALRDIAILHLLVDRQRKWDG